MQEILSLSSPLLPPPFSFWPLFLRGMSELVGYNAAVTVEATTDEIPPPPLGSGSGFRNPLPHWFLALQSPPPLNIPFLAWWHSPFWPSAACVILFQCYFLCWLFLSSTLSQSCIASSGSCFLGHCLLFASFSFASLFHDRPPDFL